MKTFLNVCFGASLVMVVLIVFLCHPKPRKVEWQFDRLREHNRAWETKKRNAEAFLATNTDPQLAPILFVNDEPWTLRTDVDDREMGFRSDGAVVWRIPPEAGMYTNRVTSLVITNYGRN